MSPSTEVTTPSAQAKPVAPRFSWPMRIFLSLLLFDIVFHSFAALTPYRDWIDGKSHREWSNEMGLKLFPKPLPSWAEIDELAAQARSGHSAPVVERVLESCDSVWDYFKPWPPAKTGRKAQSWQEMGKYAFCWVASRLNFLEHLTGVHQGWTMFSPSVSTGARVARMRLQFANGSVQEVRLTADPADLTSYSHWFEEKLLDTQLPVIRDYDARIGYCNFLAHRHRTSAQGSPLQTIYVYQVRYRYPDPDEEADQVLRDQNGPPGWDRDGPFFVYDVASRTGRKLPERERRQVQEHLAKGRSLP
jgi:hypothetical protein